MISVLDLLIKWIAREFIDILFTGSMSTLWGKGTASVRKVLNLFEMKEALEQYDQEVAGREVSSLLCSHLSHFV